MPTSGIIILPPYAKKIIDGKKRYEYRSRDLPKYYLNVPVFLLSEKKVWGIIKFTKSLWNGTGFSWKIEIIDEFYPPYSYKHPNGAQCWVKNVQYSKSKQTSLQS